MIKIHSLKITILLVYVYNVYMLGWLGVEVLFPSLAGYWSWLYCFYELDVTKRQWSYICRSTTIVYIGSLDLWFYTVLKCTCARWRNEVCLFMDCANRLATGSLLCERVSGRFSREVETQFSQCFEKLRISQSNLKMKGQILKESFSYKREI